jgi:hypothetical protein
LILNENLGVLGSGMVPYVIKYGLKQLVISGEAGNGNAFVLGFVFGYLVGVEICG